MKKTAIFCAAAALAACQPADTDTDLPIEDTGIYTSEADGTVRLILQEPVSEPRACILPIRVENGLDAQVAVTMIGFDLTGPGEDAKGNMFAPPADPGETTEARVIVSGQSCDAFDTITVPSLNCSAGGESCIDAVQFEDGAALEFVAP